MRLKRNRKYLVIIFLLFAIWHNGFCQIEKITENKKEDFEANYYQKENPKDTVLVVFDTKQGRLEITEEKRKIYSYRFKYKRYSKTYPPPANSCIMLSFYHDAGPPLGHEEYMITKSKIDPEKLIFESETEFLFWFKNTENLFEKTLILIEADDWAKKKIKVKGIEVQVHTFGSCDDLIDLTEQEQK